MNFQRLISVTDVELISSVSNVTEQEFDFKLSLYNQLMRSMNLIRLGYYFPAEKELENICEQIKTHKKEEELRHSEFGLSDTGSMQF